MLKKHVSIATLIFAISTTFAFGLVLTSRFNLIPQTHADETVNVPEISSSPLPPSFVDLATRLEPSVVNISTSHIVDTREQFRGFRSPFGDQDPFFDFFKFFGPPTGKFEQRALGSGVIISEDGYILTNNHVVDDADEITVTLNDSDSYKAKVIGKDDKTDLALIKIDPESNIATAPLGDSDALQVGEWVVAIGSPFGFGQTMTAGIVSAKGRVIGAGPYDDFIQTDASINPGNSGGPLINIQGQVVGINTAIISPSGGNVGIGFAIPIKMAKQIYPQLKEHGKVIRGWLGVSIQPVTKELAESFGIENREGALVGEVFDKSPAGKAGIKEGDIIIKFQGQKIADPGELANLAAMTPVGSKAEVTAIRKGKTMKFTVELGEYPEDEKLRAQKEESDLGLTVQNITPELAGRLNFSGKEGIMVSDVAPGGTAAKAGIRRGDIILEVNHNTISDVDDYREWIDKASKDEYILLWIWRDRFKLFVSIKNPEH